MAKFSFEEALTEGPAKATVPSSKKATFSADEAYGPVAQQAPTEQSAIPEEQQGNSWAGAAKSVGTGIMKGVDNLAGIPGTILSLADQFLNRNNLSAMSIAKKILKEKGIDVTDADIQQYLPTPDKIAAFRQENITGEDYKPQSGLENVLERTAEWSTFPGNKAAVAANALGGVTAGGLENLGYDKTGAAIGGMVGSTGASLAGHALGYSGNPIAKEILKDVPKEEINAAIGRQNKGIGQGVNLSQGQSLDSSRAQQFEDFVTAQPAGADIMQKFRQGQAVQSKTAIADRIRDLSPDQMTADDVAFKLAKTAKEGPVADALKERTSRSGPFYEASKMARSDRDMLKDVLKDIRIEKMTAGKGTELNNSLNSLRSQVQNAKRVGQLDNIIKEWKGYIYSDTANPSLKGVLGPIISKIDNSLQDSSDLYKTGKTVFAEESTKNVNPLQRSRSGQIASLFEDDATSIPFSKVEDTLLGNNAEPVQIKEFYKGVNKKDPTAWPQFTQKYLENKLDEVTKETQQGLNPKLGANFRIKVMGTDKDKANFKEMMRGVSEAHSLPPNDAYNSFSRLLDVLKYTGKGQGLNSATAFRQQAGELASQGTGTKVAESLNVLQGGPLKAALNFLKGYTLEKNVKAAAQAMTSKNAIQEMMRLAKYGNSDPRVIVGVANILRAAQTKEENNAEKPPVRIDVQPTGGIQ